MNRETIKRLGVLFGTFFKIGLFTFGGGYAMIPLIEREVTQHRKWIEKDKLTDILALSQTVPGAVAINSATLVGYSIGGRTAALAATFGVILPSFIIIVLIAAFFGTFNENRYVEMAFMGIRPAVVALIAVAAWKVGKVSVKDRLGLAVVVVSMALVAVFSVNPVFVILGGVVLGLILYWFRISRTREKKESEDAES